VPSLLGIFVICLDEHLGQTPVDFIRIPQVVLSLEDGKAVQ
jgi:hypothetical protein